MKLYALALFALIVMASPVGADEPKEQQPPPDRDQMMQVQMNMQSENQVFTSVSNVLKTRHDTAKNSIGNIR